MRLSTASTLIPALLAALTTAAPARATEALAPREITAAGTVDGGFQAPEGIVDGVYSVRIDDKGVSHFTKIGDATLLSRSVGAAPVASTAGSAAKRSLETREILRRGLDRVRCVGVPEDQVQRESAVNLLALSCGGGVSMAPGRHLWVIWGSVAAFWCNNSFQSITCTNADVHYVNYNLLPAHCGPGTPGWGEWSSPEYSIGHHAVDGNHGFCGRTHD